MPSDFKSKLFVKVKQGGQEFPLIPIVSISPNFNTPHTPEHSLEQSNRGATQGDTTFNFSLSCKAIKDVDAGFNPSKVLTEIALQGLEFEVVIGEKQANGSNGQNWAFQTFMLQRCFVNNSTPTTQNLGGSPVATFNCMCLAVTIDDVTYNGTFVET